MLRFGKTRVAEEEFYFYDAKKQSKFGMFMLTILSS